MMMAFPLLSSQLKKNLLFSPTNVVTLQRCATVVQRTFSSDGASAESSMSAILKENLQATKAEVKDISGGCGSMYSITVESPLFQGKRLVQQHRMVKELLKTEISNMHGLTITTRSSLAEK
mmetsp:Transcript_27006/g.44023  ORF Transcript_27006/g.44023 Transcript_27006/m.44023 type:complete len:121 (+) Transcript_27006:1-363(+)